MTRSKSVAMLTRGCWPLWSTAVLGVSVLIASSTPAAQSPPPVQGTIALEGTMKKFYRATNVVIVTTIDGVEHVYHFAKDLVVHGGKGSGTEALEGLRENSTVVVHYTVEGLELTAHEIDRVGEEGLKVTEGTVTRSGRGRKRITVRFDNGTIETFDLTERAAAETAKDIGQPGAGATKVLTYYSNEAGRKIAYFFKKVS